jgi:hypothetical protein
MNKLGPLSKVEKFYIENHVELGEEKISKDLDRSIVAVRNYIEDLNEENERLAAEKAKETGSTVPTKPKVDRRSLFGRGRGAVVSTQAASERAENVKSKHKSGKRGDLHKPFGE